MLRRSGRVHQKGTGTFANTGLIYQDVTVYLPTSDQPVYPTSNKIPTTPVAFGRIPSEPPRWQPRPDLLDKLRNPPARPNTPIRLAMVGPRGAGKTQLAAAFARERTEQGWDVVWLSLETFEQLPQRFSELAWALGFRVGSIQTSAEAVRSWLEKHSRKLLLVVDNALDMDELDRWLPSVGSTTALITTTSLAASNIADIVEIKPFSRSEAMHYLTSQTGVKDQGGLEDLVEELDCLPLALAQAAWVIRIQARTFSEYLDLLRSTEVGSLLARVPGSNYPRGVAEAILLSVQECEQTVQSGWVNRILDCSSVLSPTGIPREIVDRAARHISLKKVSGDYDSMLGKLVEASLLTLSGDQHYLIMHRLVQRVIRDRLRQDRRLATILAPVGEAVLWSSGLGRTGTPGHSVGGENRLALAEQAIYLWQSFSEETGRRGFRAWDRLRLPLMERRFVELRGFAAMQLLEVDFRRGEELAFAVLRDFTRVFRKRSRHALYWQRSIYNVMSEVGRSDVAIPIAEAALADAENGPRKKPTRSFLLRADLGRFYYISYRFPDAISMLESAMRLEGRAQDLFGVGFHLLRSELGNAYRAVGRRKEALRLQKLAVNALRVAADVNANVRWMRYVAERDLAISYRESGEPKKAVSLLRRVIRDCRRTEGRDSLIALMCSCDLAMTFYGDNSATKAVTTLERSLPSLVKSLGPDRLIPFQDYLATAYVKCGRAGDAVALLDRTIATLNQSLGAEHRAVQALHKRLEKLTRQLGP